MGNKRLHALGTGEGGSAVEVIFMCSICLHDVHPDTEEWTSIIVNGRRAYYHKACLEEELEF
jgi:hypothetical protein